MSTPFDVEGLWQIRLTITSPRLSRFHTQGYIDEAIKDKILAALSEKTHQSSDKTFEPQERAIEAKLKEKNHG